MGWIQNGADFLPRLYFKGYILFFKNILMIFPSTLLRELLLTERSRSLYKIKKAAFYSGFFVLGLTL